VTLLLEATGLHTYYGESHVLHGVSISVGASEVVALTGRNGMGKTTTIRSLLGLTPPRSGTVLVRGKAVTGLPAHLIARQGIALVPEGRGIFPTLTVRENLLVAAQPGRWTFEAAVALFPRLGERLTNLGFQLSGGEQQMLAIARALMTNPQLIILDGATEGLSPLVRQQIWDVVRKLREEGMALLIVDKEIRTLLTIADRTMILVKGQVAFSGTPAEFRANADYNLSLLHA
jgi:branched-chain amino acid transport system ATP-binding protein